MRSAVLDDQSVLIFFSLGVAKTFGGSGGRTMIKVS